ncbi:MAG: hypothetical protein AVDCRST_MAG32-1996, partial [uncultured Nocardioides sp.]
DRPAHLGREHHRAPVRRPADTPHERAGLPGARPDPSGRTTAASAARRHRLRPGPCRAAAAREGRRVRPPLSPGPHRDRCRRPARHPGAAALRARGLRRPGDTCGAGAGGGGLGPRGRPRPPSRAPRGPQRPDVPGEGGRAGGECARALRPTFPSGRRSLRGGPGSVAVCRPAVGV